MTQPLPTWTSWYFNQLPDWFQTLSCGVVYFSELLIPFLIFGPRRVRLIAFWATIIFQSLIAATGNYGFFNLLTIVLCCVLPDDAFWRWFLRLPAPPRTISQPPRWRLDNPSNFRRSFIPHDPYMHRGLRRIHSLPVPFDVALAAYVEPFRIANGYGLFRVMTTQPARDHCRRKRRRPIDWKPYAFKWKPGDLDRRPEFMIPHMPRLDWQMWFAALGDADSNPWFILFLQRLQEGSKPVLDLLQTNPFPDHPPKYHPRRHLRLQDDRLRHSPRHWRLVAAATNWEFIINFPASRDVHAPPPC